MSSDSICLTDLHCHLLPEIDDGAENLEASLQLFHLECNGGIKQIALTSHFNCENQRLDDFLERRMISYHQVEGSLSNKELFANELTIKLGAEVYYSPNLCDIDIKALCMEGTDILLLELPTDRKPLYLNETLYQIQSCGITPLIAHIERYPYIMKNLPILCDWIDQGIYTQINAATLLHQDKRARLCLNLLKWNLAHVVSSDAHSVHRRPPNLAEGMKLIRKQLGAHVEETINQNAFDLFTGTSPTIPTMHCPQRFFGGWR